MTQLLRPSCTVLCSGPVPQKLTAPLQVKKTPCHFLHHESLQFFSHFFFLLSPFIFSLGLQFHQVFISKLLGCTGRRSGKSSSCSSGSSFSLRLHELLKTSLASSPTFSNPQKSCTNSGQRFSQTPFMVMAITWHQAKLMFLSPCSCYSPSKWKWKPLKSRPTLCDPMDCNPSGSSDHGIFQTRVLEWVATAFSTGSSWPRDQTHVSCIACRRFTVWATGKPIALPKLLQSCSWFLTHLYCLTKIMTWIIYLQSHCNSLDHRLDRQYSILWRTHCCDICMSHPWMGDSPEHRWAAKRCWMGCPSPSSPSLP